MLPSYWAGQQDPYSLHTCFVLLHSSSSHFLSFLLNYPPLRKLCEGQSDSSIHWPSHLLPRYASHPPLSSDVCYMCVRHGTTVLGVMVTVKKHSSTATYHITWRRHTITHDAWPYMWDQNWRILSVTRLCSMWWQNCGNLSEIHRRMVHVETHKSSLFW